MSATLDLLPAFLEITHAETEAGRAYNALSKADEHDDPTQIDVALVHINNAIGRLQQARAAAAKAATVEWPPSVATALTLGRAIETMAGCPIYGPDSYSVRAAK